MTPRGSKQASLENKAFYRQLPKILQQANGFLKRWGKEALL